LTDKIAIVFPEYSGIMTNLVDCPDGSPDSAFDGGAPTCDDTPYNDLQTLWVTNIDASSLGNSSVRVEFNGIINPPVSIFVEENETSGLDGILVYFFDENDVLLYDTPTTGDALSYD
jgi:hypothetical protein